MGINKILVNPNLYIGVFLFSGRTTLDKFNIPINFSSSLAIVSLFLILILVVAREKPQRKIRIGGSEVLLFIFMFLTVFSIYYSPSPESHIKTIEMFLMIALCLMLTVTLRNKEDFSCLLLGFISLGIIFIIASIPTIIRFSGGRISVLGIGFNTIGRFTFMFIIAILVYLYYYNPNRIVKFFMFINISVGLMIIIISGSRGVYLATLVAIIVAIIVTIKNSNTFFFLRKNNIKLALFIIFGIAIFSILFKKQISYFYYSRFIYLFTDVQGGTAVNAREKMYSEAITLFSDSPIIGNGISSFSYLSLYNIYPHNLILEVGSELGILGLIVIISLIIICFRNLIRVKQKSIIIYILLLTTFCFNFITVQFSGDLYDSRLLFFTIALICVIARFNVIPLNKSTKQI